MNQRYCPFCKCPALDGCAHLALAVEGRDFVRRCIELSQAQPQWFTLCTQRRAQQRLAGNWCPEQEDFTWLETAFCEQFLKKLTWFGGMEHEWRTGPKADHGGFWVLLWSKDPQRLWWELRDEIERQTAFRSPPNGSSSWLIPLQPRSVTRHLPPPGVRKRTTCSRAQYSITPPLHHSTAPSLVPGLTPARPHRAAVAPSIVP